MIPSQRILNLAVQRDPEKIVPLIIEKEGIAGIDRLVGHPVAKVRAVLAKSPELLPCHIDKLIEDTDYFVIENLRANQNLQTHHIERLKRIVFVDLMERAEIIENLGNNE